VRGAFSNGIPTAIPVFYGPRFYATGNVNAPTIMIGERAADHILGRAMLAPSNAPYHVAPDWQTAQR